MSHHLCPGSGRWDEPENDRDLDPDDLGPEEIDVEDLELDERLETICHRSLDKRRRLM